MLGRFIGAFVGFVFGGFIGAILGFFVGGWFAKGWRQFQQSESPEALAAVQKNFFETTFILIGYLAKADGRVSEEEIKQTEHLMAEMGLKADQKREAIRLFKIGSVPNFQPEETLQNFKSLCGHRPQLAKMLVVYLIHTALADGTLDPKEEIALKKVAEGLSFSSFAFEQMLRMLKAQGAFAGSGGNYSTGGVTQADELANAYAALGMSSDATDKELKKAYRKLMSEYHPDKLMGQGVPDHVLKAATERSQEVQAAYDVIKRSRK